MSTGCVTFNSCFSSLSLAFLFFQSYRFSRKSTEAPAKESNRKQPSVLAQGNISFPFLHPCKTTEIKSETNI